MENYINRAPFFNIMKRSRLSALTGLVGLLTFGCSDDVPAPEVVPVEAVSVVEHPATPQRTPREQLDQYKGEQKDVLCDALTQEETVSKIFAGLPETMRYHDKRTWNVKTVGPMTYLFDLRTLDLPDNVTSSVFAYLRLWTDAFYNPSPHRALSIYTKNVIAKANELGLQQEYDILLLEERPLFPLYETVQHPSEEDLERFYDALAHVPQFIAKPFFAQSLSPHVEQAKALFAEEPALYQAKLKKVKCCEINSGRPQNSAEPITTGRYANGELRIPERAYGSVVEQQDMVFAPQIEDRTTPFAKFLYRRGPVFTGSLEVIMGAYYTSFDKQDFLQKAQAGLLVAQQVQE